MNTLAIDPLLIFWFISFLLSFPIPSNPQSLLFPILSSFLNPEFAFKEVTEKLEGIDKEQMKRYLIENTIFPKIGERLNDEQVVNSKFDVESVQKYSGKNSGHSQINCY